MQRASGKAHFKDSDVEDKDKDDNDGGWPSVVVVVVTPVRPSWAPGQGGGQ